MRTRESLITGVRLKGQRNEICLRSKGIFSPLERNEEEREKRGGNEGTLAALSLSPYILSLYMSS